VTPEPTYSPSPGGRARTYPAGVPSWIDVDAPDVDAALRFYGGLLGWTFDDVLPPTAPWRYVIAALDGDDVAAVAGGDGGGDDPTAPAWHTYVAVDDCDAASARLAAAGGAVVEAPADAGEGGRTATLRDPQGAEVRLWQARRRLGAQVANRPGAWNFSDLRTHDPAEAAAFYREVFGWEVADQGWSTSIRVPGYGDHLQATVDPDIRVRQAGLPDDFADVVGSVVPAGEDEPSH